MTQAELADRVNLSRHAIAQFENGALCLSPATVQRIMDALRLNTKASILRRINQHLREVERIAEVCA